MALFKTKINKDMIVNDEKFVRFDIDTMDEVKKFMMNQNYNSIFWDNNLIMLLAIARYSRDRGGDLGYKIINKNSLIFVRLLKNGHVAVPCPPLALSGNVHDTREALDYIVKFMDVVNADKKYNRLVLSEEFVSSDMGGKFKVVDSVGDFIYLCKDLIELQGGKYKSRRSAKNKFLRDHENFRMRIATPSDLDSLINIKKNWHKEKEKELNIWDGDYYPYMIGLIKELSLEDYVVVVAEIDGKIEGYISFTPLGNNVLAVVNEHYNLDIQGLCETMWYLGLDFDEVKRMGEYENDGNGGPDDSGLYRYKMSHNPISMANTKIIDSPIGEFKLGV